MNYKQFFSRLFLVAVAGAFGMGSAVAGEPIGELEANGHVQVAQSGEDGVRVSDTTYGWFSGDSVDTRSGQAILTLENGVSFGFGKETAASVSVEDGAVVTSLDSGVMLYALEDEQVELRVDSGDYRFSTHSAEARAVEVSSGPRGAAGMIKVLDSGEVQVSVHEGVMTSTDASGSVQYRVSSGETVAFDGAEPRQVNTQVGATRRDDDDDDDDGGVFWFNNLDQGAIQGLTIVAGAIGFGVQQATTSDLRDPAPEPTPVSP